MADRPIHEIRLGCVKAEIWRSEEERGMRHNVTFTRVEVTESRWNSSTSFGRDDLPLVEKVASLAMLWIYQNAERDQFTEGLLDQAVVRTATRTKGKR